MEQGCERGSDVRVEGRRRGHHGSAEGEDGGGVVGWVGGVQTQRASEEGDNGSSRSCMTIQMQIWMSTSNADMDE